jgi:hypothetical protein
MPSSGACLWRSGILGLWIPHFLGATESIELCPLRLGCLLGVGRLSLHCGGTAQKPVASAVRTPRSSAGGVGHSLATPVIPLPPNSRFLPDALGLQLRRAHRAAKPER